ncbi:retrovirus-related pol polyprotein from transposon TNT 1-94 [Tanacetum coccineum]
MSWIYPIQLNLISAKELKICSERDQLNLSAASKDLVLLRKIEENRLREQSSPPAPKTVKQLTAKRNQERAAIKSRFGGNDESKKMQMNVLKHQFENFTTAPNESLDKAYDRSQKLISQLEVHVAPVLKAYDRPSVSASNSPLVSTANTPYASTASTPIGANTGGSSFVYLGGQIPIDASTLRNADLSIDPNMPCLEDNSDVFPNEGIFSGSYDDEMNKRDERGIVMKNKARLVAQWFRQEEGIDYDEGFAPVARIEVIRLVLAFASYMGFHVYQMDVKSAFLYGTIGEELPKLGMRNFLLYCWKMVSRESMCAEFEDCMHKRFQMSSMGELTFFLGLQVKQQPDGIFISQDKYVADILKKFDICSIKTATTPIVSNKPLVKDEDGVDVDVHVYWYMIGSLMYLTALRPDIMYLKHQPKLGLWYPRDSPFELEAFSNSDYGGVSLDRKSTTVSMANLEFVDQHNMVACLEKIEGNSDFHEIMDFLTSSLIHHALTINATVDSKAVVVTKASIRISLLFNEADGTACLTNESIFQNLALIGYEGDQSPKTSSSHATTQDSRDSLEGTKGNEGDQVQTPHDSPLLGGHKSDRAEGVLNLQELFVLCTNLSNKVLALESIKDAQAIEISALKHRIKKLEKKFGKNESVSKQGRKKSKPESTLDDSTVFDDQDVDHGMEYIETKEAVDEGRRSGETDELNKGIGDKGGSTKELVSTDVPKTVSTTKPELSTARPNVDAARQ